MRAVGVIMLIVALLIAASQQLTPLGGAGGSKWWVNPFNRTPCTTTLDCISTYWCKSNICAYKRSTGQSCTADIQCFSDNCFGKYGSKGVCLASYIS